MKIVPVYVCDNLPSADKRNRLGFRSEQPMLRKVVEQRGIKLRKLPHQDFVETIALDSRVIVIEGISGSGKDTFQAYLKKTLVGKDVYDFAEGELLHSWKHIPIEGILKLKVEFMKLFVNYLKAIVSREEKAVFLLNRFHLSTYASLKARRPDLKREYDQVINAFRALPVHVFILHLDKQEIEKRSVHSERSGVWPKLQREMVANDGFRNRLEKYISQQSLMIEAAKRQRIPYSIIKIPDAPEIGRPQDDVAPAARAVTPSVRVDATNPEISRGKQELPRTGRDAVKPLVQTE